jgi:hypothetical protein
MIHLPVRVMFALIVGFGGIVVAVKDCAGKVVDYVLVENTPDPTPANPAPTQSMSCAFYAQPPDPSGRAEYAVVTGLGRANGWGWYQACPVSAKALGYVIPAVKSTGDANDATMTPRLVFLIDTAPVLGIGSGHYSDPFQAGIISVFRKAYIVGVAS